MSSALGHQRQLLSADRPKPPGQQHRARHSRLKDTVAAVERREDNQARTQLKRAGVLEEDAAQCVAALPATAAVFQFEESVDAANECEGDQRAQEVMEECRRQAADALNRIRSLYGV